MQALLKSMNRLLASSGELLQLQLSIFKSDFDVWKNDLRFAFIVLGLAVTLGFGSIPLLLYTFAVGMAALFNLQIIGALAIVAAIALTFAGVLGLYGMNRLARSWLRFHRSQYELVQNLRWLQFQLGIEQQNSASTTGVNR